MTIIADKDRLSVQNLLASELVEDVELLFFTRSRSRPFVPGMQDSQSSEETRELLEELVSLSDQLHLTTYDVDADPAAATLYNVVALPTVIVRRCLFATEASGTDTAAMTDGSSAAEPQDGATATPARAVSQVISAEIGANVRFLGMPGGYEFSTLLADIVDVSTGRTDLSADALAIVRGIDRPVHIQVFVTPT